VLRDRLLLEGGMPWLRAWTEVSIPLSLRERKGVNRPKERDRWVCLSTDYAGQSRRQQDTLRSAHCSIWGPETLASRRRSV
jgi:hypothetical protein